MKAATLALVVRYQGESPELIETIVDDKEIIVLESALIAGESSPLNLVHEHRVQQAKEECEFADYVEDLLSKPFLKADIQEHGVQWMKSKIRIEQYQRSEVQAARVIADYAFQIFSQDIEKTDFFLAGPNAEVRVKVFVVAQDHLRLPQAA